uniref:RNA cap guanine-N2 methyltransferase n=1 Tax=Mimivirus LCMiAC01 TaxID=2506608 RepID=A0A481YZ00_9VIRU|nr:MAG: RNA cap guanine-N2 methyltransferase [Mimivirus LCMiAC01]
MSEQNNSYKNKYIKYKSKYVNLKKSSETTKVDNIIKIKIKILKKRFPYKKDVDLAKLQVTESSKYSMSTNKSSKLLVNIIRKYFPNNDIIVTEGTSNVGSDTVMLAMHFKKINAIELSDITCKALIHNIKVYKQDNVKIFCGTVLDVIKETKQDVIYVDPPWGGPTYKQHKRLKLFLDNLEISEFYKVNKSRVKLFIFRVPVNYDFTYFFNEVNSLKYEVYSYMEYDKIKYYYLIVQ